MQLRATRLTAIASAVRRFFSPSSLFAAGEQGAWYDPSDLSTLFQDSAGTTPVTAVEQPVGLMLDKSKGLVLGPELVTNGTFDTDTGWTKGTGWSISGGTAIFSGAAGSQIGQNCLVPGKSYQVVVAYTNRVGAFSIRFGGTTTFFYDQVPLSPQSGVVTGVGLASGTGLSIRADLDGSISIDNISVRELPGNHAYQTTSTSRPVLRQDAGGRYYLRFDGVDDFLVTNSIDFTATDKMTVFAGVRKLSDAAGTVAELSASYVTNTGAIALFHPDAPNNSAFVGKGTNLVYYAPTLPSSPLSSVLSMQVNIAGATKSSSVIPRVNGVVLQSGGAGTTLGIGNFGNYPLYIGRRGGTSFPFNGYLYSLIVRGAQTSDTQVSQTETWVNRRTGAY